MNKNVKAIHEPTTPHTIKKMGQLETGSLLYKTLSIQKHNLNKLIHKHKTHALQ